MDNDTRREIRISLSCCRSFELRERGLSINDFLEINEGLTDRVEVCCALLQYLCVRNGRFSGYTDGLKAFMGLASVLTGYQPSDRSLRDLKSLLDQGSFGEIGNWLRSNT